MEEIVKIMSIANVTQNVKAFRLTKPAGYTFEPGQATEVSINKGKWKNERRPFTFTSLNEWPFLEFTIKIYDDHPGVIHQLGKLKEGDELIIRDVWGAITYKSPGYFIAGGAGITPFIAILRQLHKEKRVSENELFFSNKTVNDIIIHKELDSILGNKAHYVLTQEQSGDYMNGYIDKRFLTKHIHDFSKPFYICGPDKMVNDLSATLTELGANPDAVIFEK